MINYDKWAKLNESLGLSNLGIKSRFSFGVANSLLDEKKKMMKKKMDLDMGGDEDEDEDEDDVDLDVKDDEGDEENLDMKKPSDDDEDEEGGEMTPMMMKKKMGKKCMKKKMCGDKKKKMVKESKFEARRREIMESLSGQLGSNPEDEPELGSDEYRNKFFASLEDQWGNPNQRFKSGVAEFDEDTLLPPEQPVDPAPGQVGFAPQQRVGEESQSLGDSGWADNWERLGEQFQQECSGKIQTLFETWLKKKDSKKS